MKTFLELFQGIWITAIGLLAFLAVVSCCRWLLNDLRSFASRQRGNTKKQTNKRPKGINRK